VLVDPHAAWDVHDPQQLADEVRLVDQRRMRALRPLDPWAGRANAAGVKRDADDLEA
jgi:hypothetical protein